MGRSEVVGGDGWVWAEVRWWVRMCGVGAWSSVLCVLCFVFCVMRCLVRCGVWCHMNRLVSCDVASCDVASRDVYERHYFTGIT